MRILFWNHLYLPHIGGVEIYSARLAAKLIARGHQVGVVTSRVPREAPEEEVLGGVQVWRLPFHEAVLHQDPLHRIRLIKAITHRCAEIKQSFAPDVVHVNLADASALFHMRTLEAHAAPTVVTFQAALAQPATGAGNLISSVVGEANRVVGVSNFAARNIAQFTRAPLEAIDVIFPGVPPEEFEVSDGGVDEAPPTIVFLGRLVEEKGALVALEAFATLPAPVRLVLIGEGPLRAKLEARAAALGLSGRVDFAGKVSDAERKRLLAASSVLVAPSLHDELFGMIAVEGALSGLPVVASNHGGLAEIVVPGVTGELFPAGDAQALAAALAPLAADQSLARRMGRAGLERALAHFSAEQTADDYERVYRDCVAAPARRILTLAPA